MTKYRAMRVEYKNFIKSNAKVLLLLAAILLVIAQNACTIIKLRDSDDNVIYVREGLRQTSQTSLDSDINSVSDNVIDSTNIHVETINELPEK